jgi:hypothetical protein
MICRISDQPVSPAAITYRELGFGQEVDLPLHPYQIVYGRSEFTDLLAKDYDELIEELKRDDQATGDSDFFRELGYPTLPILIDHPDRLSDAIIWYLWIDLLPLTFPNKAGAEQNWKWVINSIDKVEVQNETVVVRGKVYVKQPAFV